MLSGRNKGNFSQAFPETLSSRIGERGKPRFTFVSEAKAAPALAAGDEHWLIFNLKFHGSFSFAMNWRPPHHAKRVPRYKDSVCMVGGKLVASTPQADFNTSVSPECLRACHGAPASSR